MAAKTPLIRLDISGAKLPSVSWEDDLFASIQQNWQQPALGSFATLPQRLLQEYQQQRAASTVGLILGAARRLQGRVDRLLILSNDADALPARALFQAGCQPYHNELSRGERAGYPRVYFAGSSLDNDALQGLLYLLKSVAASESVEQQWGLVIVEPAESDATFSTLLPVFLQALQVSCNGCLERMAERMIVVRCLNSPRSCALPEIPANQQFLLDDVERRFAALSPLSLVPAALMGLDVLRLLQGALALNDNLVAQWSCLRQFFAQYRNFSGWEWRLWNASLTGFETWYQHLAGPTTGYKLRVNILVDHWRCDPLPLTTDSDATNSSTSTIPAEVFANIAAAREADLEAGLPSINLILPSTQVGVLGQLFQFLQVVTAIESANR